MGVKNDYRVSAIVVLCKDCNEDVGLYPSRHQCRNTKRPKLPTLYSSTSSTSWIHSPTQSPTSIESEKQLSFLNKMPSTKKDLPRTSSHPQSASYQNHKLTSGRNTSQFEAPVQYNRVNAPPIEPEFKEEEKSVYLSHYLNNTGDTCVNGKQLWGKIRENDKWRDLINKEKAEREKSSHKLWEKMIHITMQEQIDNDNPESDDEDWQGETHVSRILREYYENKYSSLPEWLLDDRTPLKSLAKVDPRTMVINKPSCRLWEQQPRPNAVLRSQSERKPANDRYYAKTVRTNTININRERRNFI